jgi:glycosyltransferase involved in cell wall biosynthesis
MTQSPELSIVLPVYNEAENILPVLRGIEANVRAEHETLVVYDFDDDSTVPVVRQHAAEFPSARLVRNDLGKGVLRALRAGMQESRGAYVLVSMADGSDDPRDIDPMVTKGRAGAALVAGSRYMHGGRQEGGPLLKRSLSRLAGMTLHLGGLSIHDPTSNFKLYSRPFLDSVRIESEAGFELALELSVKAALDGWSLAEVPTTWRDRTAGESRFDLRAWLPHYLRWYGHYFRRRMTPGRRRHRASPES